MGLLFSRVTNELFVSTGQRSNRHESITKFEENFQMKNTLALIAVAGIATVASAQTGSLSMTSSAATVDTSGAAATFTLSVWGDADFGTAIAGGSFSLSAAGGAGIVTDMVASAADWAALGFEDQGHAGDGNYTGLIFGQLIFPPFIPAADDSLLVNGPVLLGTFAVTVAADSSGSVDWSTGALGTETIMEIFTDDGGAGVFTALTAADFGGVSVRVVPAPSAMAFLGLGGLVAGRRRR
jgi:hypothetical protein